MSLSAGHPCLAGLLLVSLGLLALGCGSSTSEPVAKPGRTPPAKAARADSPKPDREIWEMHEIDGVKVGYARTAVFEETRDGEDVLRITGLDKMSVSRAGQDVDLNIEFESVETPDGRLHEYQMEISQGPLVMSTAGHVVDDELHLELSAQGKTVSTSIPWRDDYGGGQAVDLSLARKPMEPGQSRTIKALVPAVNQLGTHELVARDYERVEMPGAARELLRIDATVTLADNQSLTLALWTDEAGEVLRRRQDLMDTSVLTFRTTREEAVAESDAARYDLVTNLSVPVDRALEEPYRSKRIRYRVELEERDPAEVFASGVSQAVEPVDATAAAVTVYSVTPDAAGNPAAPDDPPTPADRAPNGIVQSDNPKIVALADDAAGAEEDPWAVALALERFVKSYITRTDYSQAFATAADVVESRVGDCTEHSVLLAALARARGIPARVAIGLIYTLESGRPGFGYHMWNEVFIGDRWIPLDATLGQGGAGAARLKLLDSSLEGASALSCFLPVAQVAGRLNIEILEVE